MYANAGVSKQWKFIKGSYFLGPSYSLRGYRYSRSVDPNDHTTYRKTEHAFGIYQSASLMIYPVKQIGIGAAGNINLSKAVDSKWRQIVLEYAY